MPPRHHVVRWEGFPPWTCLWRLVANGHRILYKSGEWQFILIREGTLFSHVFVLLESIFRSFPLCLDAEGIFFWAWKSFFFPTYFCVEIYHRYIFYVRDRSISCGVLETLSTPSWGVSGYLRHNWWGLIIYHVLRKYSSTILIPYSTYR